MNHHSSIFGPLPLVVAAYGLTFLAAFASADSGPGKIDPVLEKRFRDEAPARWVEYLRAMPNVAGRHEEKLTRSSQSLEKYPDLAAEEIRTERYHAAFPRFVSENSEYDGHRGVRCSNPRYFFDLTTREEKGLVPYYIGRRTSTPTLKDWGFPDRRNDGCSLPNAPMDGYFFSENHIAWFTAQGLFLDRGTWLPVLTQLDGFEIQELAEIEENGKTLVRLRFIYEPRPESLEDLCFAVRGGELVLIPDTYWLIKRGKCELQSSPDEPRFHGSWTNEYSDDAMTVPTLTERRASYTYSDGVPAYATLGTYKIREAETDPDRFTLSHYGFPEPDFVERPAASGLAYAVSGLGAVLIAFAIGAFVTLGMIVVGRRLFGSGTSEQTAARKAGGWAVAGGTAVAFVALIAGCLWFGSLAACLARCNGETVFISPRDLDLGERDEEEQVVFPFEITNLTSRPMSVAYIDNPCGCRPVDRKAFPLALPPRETVPVEMKFIVLPGDCSAAGCSAATGDSDQATGDAKYERTFRFVIAEPDRLRFYPAKGRAKIRRRVAGE